MRRVHVLPWQAALLAALACGATLAPARAATPPGKMIVQWDHIIDSNDKTFEDFWGYLSYNSVQ